MLGLQSLHGPKLGEYEKASYILIDSTHSKHPINQHLLSSKMEMQVKLWPLLDPALLQMRRLYSSLRTRLLSILKLKFLDLVEI